MTSARRYKFDVPLLMMASGYTLLTGCAIAAVAILVTTPSGADSYIVIAMYPISMWFVLTLVGGLNALDRRRSQRAQERGR